GLGRLRPGVPAGVDERVHRNLGIGQGYLGTTPLQLARYTAAVANAGTLVSPHLVLAQVDPRTGEARAPVAPRARPIPIDEENWRIVQHGMELVVEAGPARRAPLPAPDSFPAIQVAGKTGTA